MVSLGLYGRGSFLKHLRYAAYACHECIDLFPGVVEAKRGAYGAFDAQAMHEWLGAMMACAHSYAEAVEECPHVEVVDISHLE